MGRLKNSSRTSH